MGYHDYGDDTVVFSVEKRGELARKGLCLYCEKSRRHRMEECDVMSREVHDRIFRGKAPMSFN